jgi:hypothetical protein
MEICRRVQDEVASKGIVVRFTGGEPSYPPSGVFRQYCSQVGYQHGMEFVDLGVAYTRYFNGTNDDGDNTSYYTARNITRHGLVCRGNVVGAEFDAWLTTSPSIEAALAAAEKVASQNRTQVDEIPAEAQLLIKKLERHRKNGGIVACLYGGMAFDMECDDGPAHNSMLDWLSDTIETLGGREDTLLLIKPHISEKRFYKKNQRPLQTFADLVPDYAPDNVIVLNPLWFNAHHLMKYMDVGLIWRSSVALEHAIHRVPCYVAGHQTEYFQAIDFPMPHDRDEYHTMLQTLEKAPAVTQSLRERSALYFKFLQEIDYIELPYTQPKSGFGGSVSGPQEWNMDALKELFSGKSQGIASISKAFTN